MKKIVTTGSIALALATVWAEETRAAGFALIEQSASGLGNAMAVLAACLAVAMAVTRRRVNGRDGTGVN